MDINDLLQALFRWIHFLAGITWIGMLYFFNLINAHFQGALEPAVRRQVVPQLMPRALWWFRWGAMFTFLSGLLILLWKYFVLEGASGFTGQAGLFTSDAGLWITMGALFGTIMWFNVWFIIWPAQKRLLTGKVPADQAPAVRKRALFTSRLNSFLSGPMLFGMLAPAHYGAMSPGALLLAVALGALAIWASLRSSSKVGKLA